MPPRNDDSRRRERRLSAFWRPVEMIAFAMPTGHRPKGANMLAIGLCRRSIGYLVSAGALAGALSLAAAARAEDVKIGILFGAAGPVASWCRHFSTPPSWRSTKSTPMAASCNGQKLQLVVADTLGTTHGSIKGANKLVNEDNVAAIVGGLTSVTLMGAAHDVTIPKGVLLISPTSTATIDHHARGQGFRLPHDPERRLSGMDAGQAGLSTRASGTWRSPTSTPTMVRALPTRFGLHSKILAAQSPTPRRTNRTRRVISPELTALSAGNPQALVLIAYAQNSGITIIKEALEDGYSSSSSSAPIRCATIS